MHPRSRQEARVRTRARRKGDIVRRSRQRTNVPNIDNFGEFRLIDADWNAIVLGDVSTRAAPTLSFSLDAQRRKHRSLELFRTLFHPPLGLVGQLDLFNVICVQGKFPQRVLTVFLRGEVDRVDANAAGESPGDDQDVFH